MCRRCLQGRGSALCALSRNERMIRHFRRTLGRRMAAIAVALLLGAAPLAAQDVYLPQEALGPGATPGMAPAQGPMMSGAMTQGPTTQVFEGPMWPDGAAYQDANNFMPEKRTPSGW